SLTNRKASPLKLAAPPILNTWPVRLPAPGIVTSRPTFVVALLSGSTRYSVEMPWPFDETQNGDVSECEIPQALIRFGSVICAALTDWSSVTRLNTLNGVAAAGSVSARPRPRIEQARPIAKAGWERALMAAELAVDRVVFIAAP